MREKQVNVRLDDDHYDQLCQLASARRLSVSTLAHLLMLDGLKQSDRQQGVLLERLERLELLVEKATILSASAIAAAVIPADLAEKLDDQKPEVQDKLRAHIRQSIRQGKNIRSAYDKGTFHKGKDTSSSGPA